MIENVRLQAIRYRGYAVFELMYDGFAVYKVVTKPRLFDEYKSEIAEFGVHGRLGDASIEFVVVEGGDVCSLFKHMASSAGSRLFRLLSALFGVVALENGFAEEAGACGEKVLTAIVAVSVGGDDDLNALIDGMKEAIRDDLFDFYDFRI